jgi:hypothetical protein
MKNIHNSANWRTYYFSPRMNQIQDLLFANGLREPQVGRLVHRIDRIAASSRKDFLCVTGRHSWLLFTRHGFLRLRKAGARRPAQRRLEALLASAGRL